MSQFSLARTLARSAIAGLILSLTACQDPTAVALQRGSSATARIGSDIQSHQS